METAEVQLMIGSLSGPDAAATGPDKGLQSGALLHEASDAVQLRVAPAPSCMHHTHLSWMHARSVSEGLQWTKMRCLREQAFLRRRKLCCGASKPANLRRPCAQQPRASWRPQQLRARTSQRMAQIVVVACHFRRPLRTMLPTSPPCARHQRRPGLRLAGALPPDP